MNKSEREKLYAIKYNLSYSQKEFITPAKKEQLIKMAIEDLKRMLEE